MEQRHQHPDRFYPVVDTLAWIKRLTALGVGTVQLRAKDLPYEDALSLVRDALAVTDGTGTNLVVNDYWQAAIDAGAKHVHLGQEDLATADVKAIFRHNLTLGLSTHDEHELEIALKHAPDYIALGPIFAPKSKDVPFAPQGIARLTEWKRRIGETPLVAIGGIAFEHARDIFAAGADSIAVVSDVTRAANPDARINQWLHAFKHVA